MEKNEVVFLFIQEEDKAKTTRRINLFHSLIDELKMQLEGRSLHEGETYESLLSLKHFNAMYMIINVDHPRVDEIIQEAKNKHPLMSIILFFQKSKIDKLQELQKKYELKYDINRTSMDTLTLANLFSRIKCETASICKLDNQRYTLIQKLGEGASSFVDLFYDNQLKRKVAVKKLKVEGVESEEKDEKIRKEVENMKNIKVPTAIEFYEFKLENDNRYIYMEFADQGTLDHQIYEFKKVGRKFTTDEIYEYLIEVMLALHSLNKKGMIHRDIKSENILLKTEEIEGNSYVIAKLSDFGISRVIDGVLGNLTQCGTPYYISPEIAAGEQRYDYNVDIWSLGVVLYELITLNKPWYEPEMGTQELFRLLFNSKYPPLPKNTDQGLQFLVSVMLKKDPNRRYTLTEILSLDFVYERIMNIFNRYNWNSVEEFKELIEYKDKIIPTWLTFQLITEEESQLLKDLTKIFSSTSPINYKASFFGSLIKNVRKGNELIDTFSDLVKEESLITKEEPEIFFKKAIEKKIMIPLSHTLDNVDNFISKYFDNPQNYYFKFTFDDFDQYNSKNDNELRIDINPEKKIDYLILSQIILKEAKKIFKEYKDEKNEKELIQDQRYLKFLIGISYFQYCDLFEIPFDDNDKSRLAFLLNLLEIMGFHFYFNTLQNNFKTKAGLLSYFKNDVQISYKFKNFDISDLELINVVFRGNKPVPGAYMRLVYNSDKKCQLLPNFKNEQPLFLLCDLPGSGKTIFNRKEVEEQLIDVTYKFILKSVVYSNKELTLPEFIVPYLRDFGQNSTNENPKGFLNYILSWIDKHRKISKHKVRYNSEKEKEFDFFNNKFVESIEFGRNKVNYSDSSYFNYFY